MTALDGLRVLDLTRHIPGPYCTMLLGDLGADVVKVEEAAGDPLRYVPPALSEHGAAFAALNRNKRSMVVDLRQEAGAAVLRRLAARADVFVEGFRPGVLDRRGLGAEALLAENARLVYCSITGYASDGPRAGRAGHDINYSALAGFLGGTRDGDGRPVLAAAPVADMSGGLFALATILAALLAGERTGHGQRVEVSLAEAALGLMSVPAARTSAGGAEKSELQGTHACYNVYRCRDGKWLSVGALEAKFWEALCTALELPHLAGRQWADGPERQAAIAALERAFAARDRDEWLRVLAERDVCVEPVLQPAEALAAETAGRVRRGEEGACMVGTPLQLSATPARVVREAPALGQHTDEVLAEAGYTAAEISALRQSRAVA